MAHPNFGISEELLGIPHVRITSVSQTETEVHIDIEFTNGYSICPHCQCECDIIHEKKDKKTIRDLQILGRKCFLHFIHRRFRCPNCNKTFIERLDWVDPYEKFTKRFSKRLSKYGLVIDLRSLSKIEGVGYSSVERIIKKSNYLFLFPNKEDFPINAGIDEFSQKKGRGKFCTIITNNDLHKPFDILPSRDPAEIDKYFNSIPPEVREKVESYTMDMWGNFRTLVKEYFPNAKIIVDRFHVMKSLNKCIDKTRRRLQKLIAKDRSEKLKNLRWIILKNNEDLTEDEKNKLTFAFECSKGIKDMYEFKENVREIFEEKIPQEEAREKLRILINKAKEEITDRSIKSFIKTYNTHEEYILNYFDKRQSNGLVEGINNRIKLIKRIGFGMPNFYNFAGRILRTFLCNYSQI